VLGSSRRRSGSRRLSPRLSPRLGRSSPPAGSGRVSGSGSKGEGEDDGAVGSTGHCGTQHGSGGGDAHSGTIDSAAGCHPQLPSVACGAPRGAGSCSSLRAPSWARHSSLPNLPGLSFQAPGCARHSGGAAQPPRAQMGWPMGGCGVAVSPGRRRRFGFGGVQSHRSWRSTRGRALFSPPRLTLEHGAPLIVPPSLAGDACGKLAELMRCCDGLQELM